MEENTLVEIIEKLRALGQEWKTVDAKRELSLLEKGSKAEFIKDIVAMANNVEPSYIIIGLEDGTFQDVGKLTRHYKKNDLNQLLVDKIDPPVIIDYIELALQGIEYGVIEVIGKNPPYIVAKDIVAIPTDRKQTRIYKGMIFVRHQDRTEGISRSELEEIFRRRNNKVFESESVYAQQLVQDKPEFWEYLLTAELLNQKFSKLREQFNDFKRGLIYTPETRMGGKDFIAWVQPTFTNLTLLLNIIKTIITEDIPASWGKLGEQGNPVEIKMTVDKLISACYELVNWETRLHSITPPEAFQRVKQSLEGWAIEIFSAIENVPDKLLEPFQQPNPNGKYTINIVFDTPSKVGEFEREIEYLQDHPEEWIND